MPHVASQIVDRKTSDEIRNSKQAVARLGMSAEHQRPATQRQKGPLDARMPSLSLLVTNPGNPHLEVGSIRHISKASDNITPISGVESVFELPSAISYNTPNSSMPSLLIAELDDTSVKQLSTLFVSSEPLPQSSVLPARFSISPHLHSSSATPTSSTTTAPQLEQPQIPARSVRLSKSQAYLHPKSPAAVASSELHFDQPVSPGPSVRSSRSHGHLRSPSATPITSRHEQPLPRLPNKASQSLLSSPANVKSRTATVIETMTAIEEDNRQLLERAVSAEMESKALHEMNLALQRRVAYCDQHHRPKTAPIRNRRAASEGTPISTFNTTPTRRRPAPLNLTAEMESISRYHDLAARGSPTRPSRRAQAQTYSEATGISGPLPGSVVRQQVIYKGRPISNAPPVAVISLAEARRREKPLPYIMPLSPSAVPGFVEMGSRGEICAEERRELRKKKTFGDMFRWGKRKGGVKV